MHRLSDHTVLALGHLGNVAEKSGKTRVNET